MSENKDTYDKSKLGKVVDFYPKGQVAPPLPTLVRYFEIAWDNPGPPVTVQSYDQMHALVDKLLLQSVSQIVVRSWTQAVIDPGPQASDPEPPTESEPQPV